MVGGYKMVDRTAIKELLDEKFKEIVTERPQNISAEVLVETFCKYVEDDYYEWLKDNFRSFFNHGNPDWDWIRGRIEHYSKD